MIDQAQRHFIFSFPSDFSCPSLFFDSSHCSLDWPHIYSNPASAFRVLNYKCEPPCLASGFEVFLQSPIPRLLAQVDLCLLICTQCTASLAGAVKSEQEHLKLLLESLASISPFPFLRRFWSHLPVSPFFQGEGCGCSSSVGLFS